MFFNRKLILFFLLIKILSTNLLNATEIQTDFKNWLDSYKAFAISKGISKKTIDTMKKQFAGKKINLHFVKKNPIDLLWSNQPKKVISKAFLHNIKFAGQTIEKKIHEVLFGFSQSAENKALFSEASFVY